jgi:tryptophan-rich sensory protein
MNKRGLIAAAFLSVFFSLIFVICGGFRLGFSLANILFLGGAGAILGLIGAPELEPKAFRYPMLWQVIFAVMGCVLLAVMFDAKPEGYALAVVIGIALGYLAPYWIKHIQGP